MNIQTVLRAILAKADTAVKIQEKIQALRMQASQKVQDTEFFAQMEKERAAKAETGR